MTRLIGREAAKHDLAERRRLIEKRNQLARAVRLMIPAPEPTKRQLGATQPSAAHLGRGLADSTFCAFDSTNKFTAGRWSR